MISFPFDSIVSGLGTNGYPIYDRQLTAEEYREVNKAFFSNGVFMHNTHGLDYFQVSANEGMNILVSTGRCMINGTVGVEKQLRELALQAASSQDRIDTVVLRWDVNIESRSIDLYILEGVASATPSRPELTRTESVYELGLCDIYIPANSTSISKERITDTRLETERCGVVMPFQSIDTTTFYDQIQAAIDAKIEEIDALANFTYLEGGFYAFNVEDEHLYVNYDSAEEPPPLSMDDGRIYYTVDDDNRLDLGRVNSMPAGCVMPFAGKTIPSGWLVCNGQAVSRTDYARLFAAIGTTYGTGNGSTTFNLPNMSGRFPIGLSTTYTLAKTGGASSHSHGTSDGNNNGTLTAAIGAAYGDPGSINYKIGGTPSGTGGYSVNGSTVSIGKTFSHGTQVFGVTASTSTVPPYLALNFIICTGE